MKVLAETGPLGSALVSVSYAFLDPDNNRIISGMYILASYSNVITHT
jgi:hypothetical protein